MSGLRLEGLEPDNPLAFLALLGLLRALEAASGRGDQGPRPAPRVAWDVEHAPVRPWLHADAATPEGVAASAAAGLDLLARDHDLGGRRDLDYPRAEGRALLMDAALAASGDCRGHADAVAALLTDGAVKEGSDADTVAPTPFCFLFGQGHQHFLERFAGVVAEPAPPRRGRGKAAVTISAADCLVEALFKPWHRADPTPSFRWDPEEDVRYALRAGNPSDPVYKAGAQHGANRLAAAGLVALTVVPEVRAGRPRPAIPGGLWDREGFSFAWPVWDAPASLAAIRALLAHPDLREPDGLAHLGVREVLLARRISVGKFMNFTRARVIEVG